MSEKNEEVSPIMVVPEGDKKIPVIVIDTEMNYLISTIHPSTMTLADLSDPKDMVKELERRIQQRIDYLRLQHENALKPQAK